MFENCTKEQLQKLYAEFNVTEESVKQDVQYLIEWIEKQPHLPNVKDEDIILNCLMRAKYQLERTKKMLDTLYTARVTMGDIFSERDPRLPEIRIAMNYSTFVPLPKPTAEGYRVMVFRIFHSRNEGMPSSKGFMKSIQLQMDLNLKKDHTRGVIFIYDFENLSMPFAVILLTALKKLFQIGVNTVPLRTRKIYLLNMTPAVEPVVRFAKNIVKKEVSKRLEIWKRPATDMIDVLPRNVLPSDYGGDEESIDKLRDLYYEHLTSYSDWFLSEEHVKADLSKTSNNDDYNDYSYYGSDGSFRPIPID